MIKTFNKSTRCHCMTKDGFICKVKKLNLYVVNNKYYCRIHFNYNFVKFIIIIQKYWRSYYCRKKINNIYKLLPCDLQKKILWHMREHEYYINLTRTINKIIKKRTLDLHKKSKLPDYYIIRSLRNDNIYYTLSIYQDIYIYLKDIYFKLINNQNFIISTCNLYNKYKYWDHIKYDMLQNVLDNILILIEIIIDNNIYLDFNNNNNNITILNNLKNILYLSMMTSEC